MTIDIVDRQAGCDESDPYTVAVKRGTSDWTLWVGKQGVMNQTPTLWRQGGSGMGNMVIIMDERPCS